MNIDEFNIINENYREIMRDFHYEQYTSGIITLQEYIFILIYKNLL